MAEAKATRRDFLKTSTAAASAAALGAMASGAYAAGSDVIRVGVVGCGGRGTGAALNAMNADPGVRLAALGDVFLDRARGKIDGLKKQKPNQVVVDEAHCFGGLDAYRRVIECVDVVLIACAAKFHPMYTKAAIEAGKHVFCEKPHAIDPAGIHTLMAATELAKQKKLSFVSGLHSRYDQGYRATVERIHAGAIGDIVAIEENFLRGPYGLYARARNLNEVQFQFSNQYHFAWLSGDDVPQSLVHNMDRATWALKEKTPVRCHGLGGRCALHGEIYGNVFDHDSVVYIYADGVRAYAFTRTVERCYNDGASIILGSKGRCFLTSCRIEGETPWHYEHPKDTPRKSPYDIEHEVLFTAIRKGEPVNNGDYAARSTMVTIMGQISCYTGKEVTWDQAMKANFTLGPKPEECTLEMEPPVKPDAAGIYPVPIPGSTTLL